ncbi:hypothetical protein TBR22_A34920 [Luteitalea sp. TBR-22]|uniref:hypothetical protein n=1 Tax=Luteitalea sp. TBR-22 TaxID=2802971 RepID=UPI001AF919CF|nr:hypothetical protein [Luteitalea sp. TBR-22]BCS34263.1 hypothetical protein TBR22_A34920 [Luteitalea sp. TBR-22]
MTHKERIGPSANLEDIEHRQRQRTEEEDEGVSYDDELDQKRLLDDAVHDHDVETMPLDRLIERDTPEQRGSLPVDDEARGEKRRKQYEGGAALVSETD